MKMEDEFSGLIFDFYCDDVTLMNHDDFTWL